jgi:cytochrome b561
VTRGPELHVQFGFFIGGNVNSTANQDGNGTVGGFRYDKRTIGLHWAGATLVVLLWCIGQSIDWFPKGAPRISARSTHIVIGALLILLLLFRIWWRSTGGRKLPASAYDTQQKIASWTHVGIYLLLLVTVSLGVANVWVRGDTVFHLFTVPAFDPANDDLREQVEDTHALLANTVAVVAALHAAFALYHHFVRRDGVLRRMLRAPAP